MKKTVLGIVMIGLTVQGFSQELLYEAKIRKEEVPAAVIESVERNYPEFTRDEYAALPLEYVENDVVVNNDIHSIDDYDTFKVFLSGKGREFTATYDRAGNLMNTMEHMKNVAPPNAVKSAITKAYPGWSLEKDSYTMTHYNGSKEKERYRVIITKGGEKMHVYTDANGKIINKPKMHKMHE